MDRQDLIDYLSNNKWYLNRIKELEKRKEMLENIKTPQNDGMPKGTPKVQDTMAENLASILDEIHEEENKYLQIISKDRPKIVKMLEKMSDKVYREILDQRYLLGIDLKNIEFSDNKKRDYKYICTLHGYALNEFDKLCEKNNEKNI